MVRAPRLIAITAIQDLGFERVQTALHALCAACIPGSVAVLLREPELAIRQQLHYARKLGALTQSTQQSLWVRDRVELAVLADAQGVHLSEQSVPAQDVRQLCARLGRSLWISRAWHAVECEPDPDADSLLVAPVAAARKGNPPLGAAGLLKAQQNARGRPVFALGGMGPEQAEWALNLGIHGVAAISAVYAQGRALAQAMKITHHSSHEL